MWQIGKGDETTTQKMENIEVKYPNTISLEALKPKFTRTHIH